MSETTIYADAVKETKNAILQSRYRAAQMANAEQLNLYYSVGKYVSCAPEIIYRGRLREH